jgi:hypothetical protein
MANDNVPNLAEGLTRRGAGVGVPGDERVTNIHTRPARGSSAGGGYSTAPDLLKFAVAMKQGRLGRAMAAESRANGGLGIAGGAPGINAALESDFQSGFTTIVLSNYDPPSAEGVAKRIRGLVSRLEM